MSKTLARIKFELAERYDLTEKQIEVLNFVMLPKALRPSREYLVAKLGITTSTYYSWLRDERFNLARRDFLKQYFKDEIPDVLMAMKDEALAGNERAARLFLEYVDDFGKEAKLTDPNYDPIMPQAEIKIIINTLQQKFYGKEHKPQEPIEGEISQATEA